MRDAYLACGNLWGCGVGEGLISYGLMEYNWYGGGSVMEPSRGKSEIPKSGRIR